MTEAFQIARQLSNGNAGCAADLYDANLSSAYKALNGATTDRKPFSGLLGSDELREFVG
jgi:hypothetical protein